MRVKFSDYYLWYDFQLVLMMSLCFSNWCFCKKCTIFLHICLIFYLTVIQMQIIDVAFSHWLLRIRKMGITKYMFVFIYLFIYSLLSYYAIKQQHKTHNTNLLQIQLEIQRQTRGNKTITNYSTSQATRNAWQSPAYSPLGAVVSPLANNNETHWSPHCLAAPIPIERTWRHPRKKNSTPIVQLLMSPRSLIRISPNFYKVYSDDYRLQVCRAG